ncbi:MAG: hypothetical protein U0271_09820 [Polyangiaceae bacterium]
MTRISCVACGSDNDAGCRFCTRCGKSVEPRVVCSRCSTPQPLTHQYCMGCGAPMSGAAWTPSDGGSAPQGAVIDGVWERAPGELARRVDPEDCRTFLGSRVVEVPVSTIGVVVVDGLIERVLPPGERTSMTLFERIEAFFLGRQRTAFFLLDLRPVLVPFRVETRPQRDGRVVETQVIVSFSLQRGNKEGLASFLANVLGTRAALTAQELHDWLRPDVATLATAALERLSAEGRELDYEAAELAIRRALEERLAHHGLGFSVVLTPLTSTSSCNLRFGAATETDATAPLFTRDDLRLEVDLVVRVQGQDHALASDAIAPALGAALSRELRCITFADLTHPGGFTAVERAVRGPAEQALASHGLVLVSIALIDVRDVRGEWILGARDELQRARDEVLLERAWPGKSAPKRPSSRSSRSRFALRRCAWSATRS